MGLLDARIGASSSQQVQLTHTSSSTSTEAVTYQQFIGSPFHQVFALGEQFPTSQCSCQQLFGRSPVDFFKIKVAPTCIALFILGRSSGSIQRLPAAQVITIKRLSSCKLIGIQNVLDGEGQPPLLMVMVELSEERRTLIPYRTRTAGAASHYTLTTTNTVRPLHLIPAVRAKITGHRVRAGVLPLGHHHDTIKSGRSELLSSCQIHWTHIIIFYIYVKIFIVLTAGRFAAPFPTRRLRPVAATASRLSVPSSTLSLWDELGD